MTTHILDFDSTLPLTIRRDTGDYETMAPVPYSDAPSDYRPPFTASSDYFDYFKAPGPLALSAVALFGNESHFAAAQRASALNDTATSRSLCDTARLPFASIARLANTVQGHSCSASVAADPAWAAATQLLWWFQSFNSTDAFPPTALGFATFYANDALLALASLGNDVFNRRVVYASDGRTTQKPRVPLPALVALSVLLLVEVAGLLAVAYYAWKTPTWTDTLKSATVARLANAMERDTLPPAGWHGEDHQAVFERLEGRIGVAVRPGEDGEGEVRQLVHGGSEALNPPTGKRKRAAHISFRRRGQRGAG